MSDYTSLEDAAKELARKWFYRKERTEAFYDEVVNLAELFETDEYQILEAIRKATTKLAPPRSKAAQN